MKIEVCGKPIDVPDAPWSEGERRQWANWRRDPVAGALVIGMVGHRVGTEHMPELSERDVAGMVAAVDVTLAGLCEEYAAAVGLDAEGERAG